MKYSDNLFESGPAGRGCLDLKLHLFEQMLRGLGSLRSRSVLDVGCGDGTLSGMMARRGARVVGLDKRSGRTSAVETRLKKARVEFVWMDIADFTATSRFDIVTAFFTLNEIPSTRIRRSLTSIRRALKPGGRFIFVIPHPAFAYSECTPLVLRQGLSQKDYLSNGLSYQVTFHFGSGTEVRLREHHMSLGFLVNSLTRAGLIVRFFKEITYGKLTREPSLPYYLMVDTTSPG